MFNGEHPLRESYTALFNEYAAAAAAAAGDESGGYCPVGNKLFRDMALGVEPGGHTGG